MSRSRVNKLILALVFLLLSAIAGWYVISAWFGSNSGWPIGGALMSLFGATAALAVVGRVGSRWLVAAGLLMIGVLVVPATLFAAGLPGGSTFPFGIPQMFTSLTITGLAILVAAALLYAGASREQGALGPIAVGGLLLAFAYYVWFWLIVWDSTYDSIGLILLPVVALAAILAGVTLLIYLSRRRKLVGLLFTLLVPAGLILMMALAQRPGFRVITATRAERLGQALDKYYVREGRYPEALHQLVPRDTLFISRPVVLFGQEWCYESSGDSYQLAYVDRGHWSAPDLFGRVVGTAGDVYSEGLPCAAEIDHLAHQFPDFFLSRE